MKQQEPQNFPSLKCVSCGKDIPPYERWANNQEGLIFCVEVDIWPTYFLDVMGVRMEFCDPGCVIRYMNKDVESQPANN